MDGQQNDYDVAVIGYGPVGAFTALLLARSGLHVAIFEKSIDPVVLPRAVGLDGESFRAFQRIGIADAVGRIVQPPRERDEVCFTNSKREPLFGLEIPHFGHNGWMDVIFFDQPELEALLREIVAAEERIDVFLGDEATSISQDDKGVLVETRNESGARRSRVAYAVGCDGASSFVRRALGIEWLSLGYDQDWLVVDIVHGPDSGLPLVTMQVCDPRRLETYVCCKDPNRRWEFQLIEGESAEEMLRPEKVEELLRPWVAPEHYEIRRTAVYQFHAATAARWNEDRVFLAGDSAHQTPPFLGQGLNAGFRDAVNLGWKIPLVLTGKCDEALLETYGAERDAHARDLVEWAVDVGKLMETLAAAEAGLPDPHPGVDQSAGYGQGRTTPPLRDGVLAEGQTFEGSPVGYLLAQPRVRHADGTEGKLDELIGGGFAVIGRTEKDVELGERAKALLARLGGRTVSLDGLTVTEGAMDALFEDHAAAVLRPDRYVFGVAGTPAETGSLVEELAAKLHLR